MFIRALRKILESERASAGVEFALIVPVMLFIYLGGSYVSTLASLNKKLQTAAYAVNNLVPYPRDYCSYRAFVRSFHASGGSKAIMGQFVAPYPVDGQPTMVQYTEGAPDVDNLVTVKATVRYSFNTGFWGVVNSVAAATPGASNSSGIVPSVFSLGATSAGVTVHKNPAATCASGLVRLVGPAVTEFVADEFNSFSVRAEEGIPPYQIRLKSILPVGLSFTPNGADADISGAITETCTIGPCDPETLNVTLEAEDSSSEIWAGTANTSVQKTFQISLIHTLRLTVPDEVGTAGVFFRATAPVRQGGKPGYTYSIANAPPGLTINAATGVVEGTPQAPGVYDQVSITVRDARGTVVTDSDFVYDIKPPALTAWADGPFQATGGVYAAVGIHARGGWGTITVSCSGFPVGIVCGPSAKATPYDGTVNGAPQQLGEGWGTITFRDSSSQTQTVQMYWNVKPPALSVWAEGSLNAAAGGYARGDIVASGGWGNLTIESMSGTPAGISWVHVGYWRWAIHGYPSAPGSGPITVVVRDDAGQRATAVIWYSFTAPPLTTSKSGDLNDVRCCDRSYTRYVYSSGGWGAKSASHTTLPPGMSFGWDGNTAWITGEPNKPTSQSSTRITIRDAIGQVSYQDIIWDFTAPPMTGSVTRLWAIHCNGACNMGVKFKISGGYGSRSIVSITGSGSPVQKNWDGTNGEFWTNPVYPGATWTVKVKDASGQTYNFPVSY